MNNLLYFVSALRVRTQNDKLENDAAAFGYIDKILIVLSAASGGVCIILSVSVVRAPVGQLE